jgi:hypothetical protein
VEARVVVHGEREMILDMLHALRMDAHHEDMGLHGLQTEEGGEGHDEEGKALAGRHGREQQQLADDIKKQEEARVNTLESTLRAQAARQKSLADETQKSETEAAAASLAVSPSCPSSSSCSSCYHVIHHVYHVQHVQHVHHVQHVQHVQHFLVTSCPIYGTLTDVLVFNLFSTFFNLVQLVQPFRPGP